MPLLTVTNLDIVLTQKDADFIANAIRSQIKDLQEAYEEALREGNKRSEFCMNLVNSIENEIGISEDSLKAKSELEQIKNNAVKGLVEKYETKLTTYYKVLQLVMCGSES